MRSGSLTALLMAYVQYFGWVYMCECTPGGGDCTPVPYPGTPATWPGGNIGWDEVGTNPNAYDLTIYDGAEIVSEYFDQVGVIGILWDYPTSEGGNEPGTHRKVRAWSNVRNMAPGGGSFDYDALIFDADSTTGGFATIANWTVMVCPANSGPPPITPPDITPPDDPGVPTPITPTCATLDDVCAAIDSLRTLVRLGALGYLGTNLQPTGVITMTDDNHATVIADALTFHVDGIPASAAKVGTDEPVYPELYGRSPLGWWAVGSQVAWYDRHYLHYSDQHSGLLPMDVTRITWSISTGVTVTATTYVRGG